MNYEKSGLRNRSSTLCKRGNIHDFSALGASDIPSHTLNDMQSIRPQAAQVTYWLKPITHRFLQPESTSCCATNVKQPKLMMNSLTHLSTGRLSSNGFLHLFGNLNERS